MEGLKVLLVEDEPTLAAIVKESLEKRGFSIILAANGVEGWTLFRSERPDVCVIDVMMPRKDGFSLVGDIRLLDEQVPLIFLTARVLTEDVLKGFELGADDYIKKPFSMEELILRLKAIARRKVLPQVPGQSALQLGSFRFNPQVHELSNRETTHTLSQRESELLLLLVQHRNRLLDRRLALIKLWGEDTVFTARSMDVYISRLRKYLRDEPGLEIVNSRGQGYSLIDTTNINHI
ncbi:response regulator transcription factor [Mucilaginibacter endophyticus]|uniref:response regulator transcription factor n=1 Tax=Mucilaginibacter endophyticus TaxID=2675003 RepID=UPI000E0D4E6D|nr:response regulator transcription factor [Mucilaginibacter endophyticus]